MGVNEEQMYLGDVISAENVQAQKKPVVGLINQSTTYGKYVDQVLRESLLVSSLL